MQQGPGPRTALQELQDLQQSRAAPPNKTPGATGRWCKAAAAMGHGPKFHPRATGRGWGVLNVPQELQTPPKDNLGCHKDQDLARRATSSRELEQWNWSSATPKDFLGCSGDQDLAQRSRSCSREGTRPRMSPPSPRSCHLPGEDLGHNRTRTGAGTRTAPGAGAAAGPGPCWHPGTVPKVVGTRTGPRATSVLVADVLGDKMRTVTPAVLGDAGRGGPQNQKRAQKGGVQRL